MIINKFTITDYKEVYNLWINTPGMGLNNIDDSEEGIKKYLERNPNTCFVAKENNKILGVILAGHDVRRGYIHHTAVDTNYRKQGIGKSLVAKAIEALKEQGIQKVAFVVFKKNQTGNIFWDKLGFKEREDLVYRNKVISEKELKRIDT